jgi:hypothetical protein
MQLLFTLPARRISSTAEEVEEQGKQGKQGKQGNNFCWWVISAKLV